MLADLFWRIATSDLLLAVIAVLTLAMFLIAHVPLVARLLPSLVPYQMAARLLSIVFAGMLCFLIGYRVSDDRAEARQLQIKLAWTSNELAQQKATTEEKEKLADEKAAEADQLQAKVDDYEKTLAARPATSGNCDALDDVDLDGLRALRRRAGAGRHLGANPKGLRGAGSAGPAAGP